MATVSPVTPDPSGADVSGNSITSTAAEASTSAGTTTFDGGLTAPSSSAAVQPGLTSTLLAPHPPDTSSATYSPTVLSKPAPSQVSSPALQLSSGLPISSSSLPQTYSGPSTSTSITPDTQIINPSSSTVPAPTSGNGLSTGAVAGIAVGCAVAGLAIGLLASVFLLRRRIKSASEQLIESRPGGKSPDPRSLMATPVEPATAVSDLDQFLPVPKSDKELAGELQSLGYLIQQHVEDNYHLLPLGESPESLSQLLVDLGVDDGGSSLPKPGQLASMALDPSTRPAALQHIIARVIFGSLTVKSAGEISLLPPSVSSLVREMPPCEKHMGDPQGIVRGTSLLECRNKSTDESASHLRCPRALAPDHRFPA